MKTVIVFQGGGSLGAFGAGAWSVLSPFLQRQDGPVIAVAGASIGAINAALVAHQWRAPDRGAQALERLWRERMATPSLPFFGLGMGSSDWSREVRSWNGFLTFLLVGSRGMAVPQLRRWNPWDGLRRVERPLFDRTRLRRLLDEWMPGYASAADPVLPLLVVGATDLLDGELRLFDSDAGTIGALPLMASAAIPLLFEPIEIDGRLYCDGELLRQSMLPGLLSLLRDRGRLQAGEPVMLITIEQLPRKVAELPRSGAELAYRLINLLQIDKLSASEMKDVGQWVRVLRDPLPKDAVSGQFDYSPERIDALIQQGVEAAQAALRQALPASGLKPARAAAGAS